MYQHNDIHLKVIALRLYMCYAVHSITYATAKMPFIHVWLKNNFDEGIEINI